MTRILKFGLPDAGPGSFWTAGPARILAIGWQQDQLVAWVEADPGDGWSTRVHVATTGDQVPAGEYVGSAQIPVGSLAYVVHVYRVES